MLKVLLAGGGTAGHINPALAIASIIKQHHPDAEFLYAGTPKGMEATLVPKAGYNFTPIKVSGFQRKITPKNIARNIKAVAYLTTAGHRAKQIIKEFKPDIVIGTGGYVSAPVVYEATKMGIKTAIHEQNAFPGITTKFLAKRVDHVMLTTEEALKYLEEGIKYTVTGLPVREGFIGKTKAEAKAELGLDNNLCILSWGGSLGAGMINQTASDLIAWDVKNNLQINHIHSFGRMGKDTFEQSLTDKGVDYKSNPRLMISEYIHNMDTCTAAADIIICRAGASAISELEALGRASILIPSPVVTGNHQYHNAMVLGKVGAAIVIEQKDLTSELLIKKVEELYKNPSKIDDIAKKAGEMYVKNTPDRIYSVIDSLLN